MGQFGKSNEERAEELLNKARDNPEKAKSDVDEISGLLGTDEEKPRAYAASTLGSIAGEYPEKVEPFEDDLEDLSQNDSSEFVRYEAEEALEALIISREESLEKEIERLSKEYLDTREVEKKIEEGELDEAQEALEELKGKYLEYKDTLEKIENFDEKKSSLATRLADKEIDREIYENAREDIEGKKADLEEDLAELREEIIHEDYEKPF